MSSVRSPTGRTSPAPTDIPRRPGGGNRMSDGKALLVVDVQRAVVDWEDPASEGEKVLGNINHLLSKAREAGAPVLYVQHDGEEGGRLFPGAQGWEIHPAVAPAEG